MPSTNGTTVSFGYDTTNNHPDRLTSFNGKTIGYNPMGCPTSYNGKTFNWTGDKLTQINSGTLATGLDTYNYTYNAFGQRVEKSFTHTKTSRFVPLPGDFEETLVAYVTNSNTKYYYDHSGRLLSQYCVKDYSDFTQTSTRLEYLYDESGMIGFKYNASGVDKGAYYFQRNLLGDVVAIYDTNGTRRVKYNYDAFGNCSIASSTTDYTLAVLNPIRYRGYYYDTETGWYFLNARYYSPEWRRFISPDDTAYLDSESVNGLNLYCYCNNDPVNYCDPSGHSFVLALTLIGLGIGVVGGLGYATYTDYQDDSSINGSIGWQRYLGYSVIGGAIGAGIGFTIGYFGASIASFLSSSLSFTLPSLGTLNMGSSLALVGGTTVTITGAQIATGALGGLVIMFSWGASRYTPKDTRSNYVQNEEFERICNEYDLSQTQRERIHHRITKKGFTLDQIRKLIERLYPNLRR